MIPSAAEFARWVSSASTTRAGFEATQIIESGGLRIEAAIRRTNPRSIHVEYKTYQSPWNALEEALSGHVEHIGDELCGLGIHGDGQTTWVYDPSTDTAIRKLGNQLFEPIPGLATLGELSFLDTLTQDFLLRDMGEEQVGERPVRRLVMKPKQAYRSQLLSAVSFPIRKATIDFDTETLFPLHISFVPSSGSPAASIVGPDATIRISYKDVRFLETAEPANPFEPPAGTRVFEESRVAVEDAAKLLPFPASLAPLSDHGFDTAKESMLVSIGAENERVYATAQFSVTSTSSEEDAPSPRLTLTLGNYISRNMARRRATLSEMGKPPSQDALPLKLLDRRELWEQRLPGIDTQYAPVEAFFEKEGVFWFLSGTGMDLDAIETLARDLFNAEVEADA